jgi:hypothetical protein
MNLGKKIVSVAAGVALIAGAGAMAAAPAQANKGPQPKGETVIAVPVAVVGAAMQAGVTVAPIVPAKAEATTDVVGLAFPVSGPLMDGVVHHKGGLSFSSSKTGVVLTFSNPTIEYATSGGTTAEIKGTIQGIPAGNPLAAANGQRVALLTIDNFKVTNKQGKISKNGKKGFKRTVTQTITGEAKVSSVGLLIDGINALLGAPGLFKAGMDFGAVASEWSITKTCKTKKACA